MFKRNANITVFLTRSLCICASPFSRTVGNDRLRILCRQNLSDENKSRATFSLLYLRLKRPMARFSKFVCTVACREVVPSAERDTFGLFIFKLLKKHPECCVLQAGFFLVFFFYFVFKFAYYAERLGPFNFMRFERL